MKRFWLILLSLGLIVAFSTSAMAVDLKFSGEYYAAGMYLDRTTLHDGYMVGVTYQAPGPSTAFYYQRLRLRTDFIVSPGLTLTTRADIMERAWGANRSPLTNAYDTGDYSAGTRAENENIAFDLAYVTYVSPIGVFLAGYQIDGAWGTVFGDDSIPVGKIGYMAKIGSLMLGIQTGKNNGYELSRTAIYSGTAADRDSTFYTAWGRFSWKGGEAGLLGKYIRNASNRGAYASYGLDSGVLADVFVILPYAKVQLGPVALQAEFNYLYGKQTYEGAAIPVLLGGPKVDVDMRQMRAWIDAVADFGMIYAGGTAAYVSGDDPATKDKAEGGTLTGGSDWNPCLILFNNDLTYWAGSQIGVATTGAGTSFTANSGPMTNAWFLQVRGGIRPVEKLDIMASVSYAKADKTPADYWSSREYGWEVDLTGTYKITNNLSYMLGAGYLFTGDYFRGGAPDDYDVSIKDNFMVINKLTLTF
jgi:hypothetical protein